MQSSGGCRAALGYIYVHCDPRKKYGEKRHKSVFAKVRTARARDVLMFEVLGGEPGLCKAPGVPELCFRAVLMLCKFPGWVWLGCHLSVWVREWGAVCSSLCSPALWLLLAPELVGLTTAQSPAILHYAVTPVTAVQIFAGLCSGVWPLHP